MQTSPTVSEINKAFIAAQGSVGVAIKVKQNPHLKNWYADFGAVWEVALEALQANDLGLFLAPGRFENATQSMECRLLHGKSGEWMEWTMSIPVKADAQGAGSGITYARRYATSAILGIIQDDDDGHHATKAAEKQAPAIKPAPAAEVLTKQEYDSYLHAISNAADIEWLKKVFADAFKKAQDLGDLEAVEDFTAAKDTRKAELSVPAPAAPAAPARGRAANRTPLPMLQAGGPAAAANGDDIPY